MIVNDNFPELKQKKDPLEEGIGAADIIIEDDEMPEMEYVVGADGSVTPQEAGLEKEALEIDWFANLAEHMDSGDMATLCGELIERYDADDASRSEWKETCSRGLELLGLKMEEKTEPWKGASAVTHPIMTEALVRYTSEAILELYPAEGPANATVVGTDPEMVKRAERVKNELNYYCLYKMPEDRHELEATLWRQALYGSCLRKTYHDPILQRPTRRMVSSDDFVVNYGTTDLWTCPFYAHRMPTKVNDVLKSIAVGMYIDYDPQPSTINIGEVKEAEDELSGQTPSSRAHDEDVELLEIYVDVNLPGFEREDGVAVPYIITVDKTNEKIVAVYRNHTEEKPYQKIKTHFTVYRYMPGFGFYGFGLIHLLGSVTDASTSVLRQLIDAGTISNIPAGFKSRALRIKGDNTPLRPGELRDVDTPPGMIKGSIEWAPTREPSVALLNMLPALVDEARRVGSVSDMKIGDSGQEAPVGTTLALIERHMRVQSAVQARNNISMGEELRALRDVILENEGPDYEYPMDGEYSRAEDFGPPISVIPVADPAATTQSQRVLKYSAAIEMAERYPEGHDRALLYRGFYQQLGIPNADKIVPLQDDFVPEDPVTENMKLIMMRPVKVFVNQDHEAHLTAHNAAMQDPLMMQQIGQSPNAAAIQSAAMAHILEHVAYAYREKMQAALGASLPTPDQPMPPEMEAGASRLIAQAAQQVLQQDAQQAQAMEAQAAAQDPTINLKQMELALKGRDQELKERIAEEEAEVKREELAFQERKLKVDTSVELAKIDQKDRELQQQTMNESANRAVEGARMGLDAAKHRADSQVKEKAIAAKPKTSPKPKGRTSK